MHSLRGGTSVVLRNTIRLHTGVRSIEDAQPLSFFLIMDSASPLACSMVRAHPRERCVYGLREGTGDEIGEGLCHNI